MVLGLMGYFPHLSPWPSKFYHDQVSKSSTYRIILMGRCLMPVSINRNWILILCHLYYLVCAHSRFGGPSHILYWISIAVQTPLRVLTLRYRCRIDSLFQAILRTSLYLFLLIYFFTRLCLGDSTTIRWPVGCWNDRFWSSPTLFSFIFFKSFVSCKHF